MYYLLRALKQVIIQREEARKAKIDAERRIEEERIAKEKAELERIEAEKQANIDAERKIEEERIAKEKAIKEANDKRLKDSAELEIRRQEANKAKREELANKGLGVLKDIDDFKKGKNIIKEYKKLNKTIDIPNLDFIKDFVKRCYGQGKASDWKNVKRGYWKDVKSWTNQDFTNELFDEITNK